MRLRELMHEPPPTLGHSLGRAGRDARARQLRWRQQCVATSASDHGFRGADIEHGVRGRNPGSDGNPAERFLPTGGDLDDGSRLWCRDADECDHHLGELHRAGDSTDERRDSDHHGHLGD